MKFSKSLKGSISIFLCLILLPMVTYSTMIVDATRLQTSRSTIASAGDLAMNAALSEYERTLEDMYGLFAVSESPDDLKDHLRTYFTETIESRMFNGTVDNSDIDTKYLADSIVNLIFNEDKEEELTNLINLKVEDFEYSLVPGSTLANQAIMKKQIVEYMKYKGPVSLVSNVIPKLDFLKDSSKQTEVLQKKIEYTQTLDKLKDSCVEAWKEIEGDDKNAGYKYYADYYNTRYEEAHKVLNTWIGLSKTNFVNMSACILMDKNTSVTEKLPDSYISAEALNQYREQWGVTAIAELAENETDIEKVVAIMNSAKEAYCNIVNVCSDEKRDFEKNHLSVSFGEFKEEEIESDEVDEFFSSTWNTNIYTNISVETLEGSESNTAYKKKLDDCYNELNDMVLEKDDKIDSGYIYDYFNKQNQYYEEAQNFKADFEKIAAAIKLSQEIKDKYNKAFKWYEYLVKGKVIAAETAATTTTTTAVTTTAAETTTTTVTTTTESAPEKTEEELKAEKNERKNNVLKEYNYFQYKYYDSIISGINKKIQLIDYEESIDKFVDIINDTSLYMIFADKYSKKAIENLCPYYEHLDDVSISCNSVIKALEKIEGIIKNTAEKKETWQNDINKLSEGSTKSAMQSDLDTTTDGLNLEEVTALKNVFIEIKNEFDERIDKLVKVTFLNGTEVHTEHLNGTITGSVVSKVSANTYSKNPEYDIEINNKKEEIFQKANEIAERGFDRTSLSEEEAGKKIKARIIKGEEEEEKFYLTLKSIAEPLKSQVTETQQNAVDSINQTSEVDEEGNPKAVIPDSKDKKEEEKEEPEEPPKEINLGAIYQDIAKEAKSAEENKYKATGGNFSMDGDYNDNANNAKNSLSQATKILKVFSDIGTNAIQHAYLEEYFTEMFTCRTDPILAKQKNIKLLNGYSTQKGAKKQINTSNPWYGNEIEYILWGNDDLNKNRAYTDSWIYVVRFALNAIYAFTAADIQAFALEVATVIAGWTVIGIPIVQACVTIAIAMAESAYDLKLLHDGKDVAIYKNGSNFVCSPTGLTSTVAKDVTEKLINDASDKLKQSINSKIDEIGEHVYEKTEDLINDAQNVVNDYVEQEADTVCSTIVNQFVTPIINSMSNVFTDVVDSTQSKIDSNVESAVELAFNKINENINSMPDGLIKTFSQKLYEKTNLKSTLTDKIKTYYRDAVNNATNGVLSENPAEKLREYLVGDEKKPGEILESVDKMKKSIKNEIEKQAKPLKDKITNIEKEGTENIKSILNDGLDEISSSISSSASEGVGNIMNEVNKNKPISLSKNSNKSDAVTSGGFTLNYKEYCKIMVFVKLINPITPDTEGKMLNRAATLMQANVMTAKNNPNENFKITEAYTLVGVKANVKMGTLFPWAVEVEDKAGVDGSVNAELDLSHVGQYYVNIKYNAVNGY